MLRGFASLLALFIFPVNAENAHWAWQPLTLFDETKTLDDFVENKLAEKGLTLSKEADRRTLIRRLTFDLHGLPPKPEEVAQFVEDPDPEAYRKLVDRLLDSPHYGERYARHWLDLAHYADTHGFERDRRRPHAWRYRDYVIDAFNSDKPYRLFLEEQIAGDFLWPEHPEPVIATGFLAAGPWDFVGQVETSSPILRRSARSLDLDDIATQVMTATVATTINCARCHDHKLDPISQKEYYQLRAVFAGITRGDRSLPSNPEALEGSLRSLQALLQKLDPSLDLADAVGGGDGTGSGNYRQGIDPRTGKTEHKPLGYLPNVKANTFVPVEHRLIDGVFIPRGGKDSTIPISSSGLTISGIAEGSAQAWDLIRNGPVNSQHSSLLEGIRFEEGERSLLGLHANAGITFDLKIARESLQSETLKFTAKVGYFGHLNESAYADARILLDGKILFEHRKLKRADGLQDISLNLPPSARFLTLLSTDGGNGISMDQIGFGEPALRPAERPRTPAQQKELAKTRAGLRDLQRRVASGKDAKVFAVVRQKKAAEIRQLQRGDPESPHGPPLSPGAPSLLSMLPSELGATSSSDGERRVALARWITHPANPLTPRVIVNRLWYWHFGQGLVRTPSDFGRGGDAPSHPALLDWLADQLLDHDWSLKGMHRIILNSATYKQESRFLASAPAIRIDAGNRLLWRQNPRRLEAEAVRDTVLQVSGSLNLTRGGPGFEDFTYREAYAPEYTYITADRPALWRRSIYRYVVRTTPNPFLSTLDCPDPANFAPVRLATTTPLQSLALSNNELMLLQAKRFAKRLERDAATWDGRIHRAFELAFGRPPNEREQKASHSLVEEAGLFALCRALFTANEFVYVD